MDQFRSPETYDWRYSSVRFKASHNSYDREEQPVTTQLPWNNKQLNERGCRGLELDLQQSDRGRAWSVAHDGGYSQEKACQLSSYLRGLRKFSDENPEHDVITVTLDLKHEARDVVEFPDAMDSYIARYLGIDVLYTPNELQGPAPDLVSGATATNWPTLRKLRGKFILCLSGNELTKAAYAESGRVRLCFADLKVVRGDAIPSTRSGTRVFLNFDWTTLLVDDDSEIRTLLHFAAQRGFVTRVYLINDPGTWWKAVVAKANIVTTDKVCKYWWARAGNTPFARLDCG